MADTLYTYEFSFDKTRSELTFLNDILLGHYVLEFTESQFLDFRHQCENKGLRVVEITRYIPEILF
jgi:hypothetical protein